jgi:hypothetical protein
MTNERLFAGLIVVRVLHEPYPGLATVHRLPAEWLNQPDQPSCQRHGWASRQWHPAGFLTILPVGFAPELTEFSANGVVNDRRPDHSFQVPVPAK